MPIVDNTLTRFLSAPLCDVQPVELAGVTVYVRPLSYTLLAEIRAGRWKDGEEVPVAVAHALCDQLGHPLFTDSAEDLALVASKPLPVLAKLFQAALTASVPDVDAAKKN